MKYWFVLQTVKHCARAPSKRVVVKAACPLSQVVSVLIVPLPTRESSLTTQLPPEGPG